MAAIFDLFPIRTSGILRSTSVVLPNLENLGIAVGISLLSCIVCELHLIPFLRRHFGFLTSGFIRQCFWWRHWKVYPKNLGVNTKIVFLSRRIAELLGGGNFTTHRGPRYKIRSAVRGLNPTWLSHRNAHIIILWSLNFLVVGYSIHENYALMFCATRNWQTNQSIAMVLRLPRN